MSSIINRTDLTFLLRDWLQIDDLFERSRFDAHSFETTEAMLDVAERIGLDLFAPSLRPGDRLEPWIDDEHNVHVEPSVKEAVLALARSGMFGAVFEGRAAERNRKVS